MMPLQKVVRGSFRGVFCQINAICVERKNPSRKYRDGFFITSFLLHPRVASAE
jgi:hypothetical protein